MRLEKLAQQLGLEEDEFLELVTLFVETSRSDLDRLKSAMEAGDADGVVEAAHSIKGASANLGFMEISSLAKDMEQRARGKSLEGAQETMLKIQVGLGEVMKTLEGHPV